MSLDKKKCIKKESRKEVANKNIEKLKNIKASLNSVIDILKKEGKICMFV